MLSIDVLLFALSLEAGLVVVCLVLLLLLQSRIVARRRAVESAVAVLEPLLRDWLVLNAPLDGVVIALRNLPPHSAFRALARLVTRHVSYERQQALAVVLRAEPWVVSQLRTKSSPFWWRRFDAARLLSIVGLSGDAPVIERLLNDGSAAVRLVAFDAASRLKDRPLIERELNDLPTRQDAVQAYQMSALGRHPGPVSRALRPRLSPDAPVQALNAWIDASGALADPEALRKVRDLSSHASPEVRVHVARALRRLAEPETVEVLLTLLVDADWRVRAQAARALGALRAAAGIDALAVALCDRGWWVRYRSALALAQIGGAGRDRLHWIANAEDALARDMAQLVSGLSQAAVIEMSEV